MLKKAAVWLPRLRGDGQVLSLAIQAAVLTIPVAAPIFKVAPLPIEDWVLMGTIGILPFVVMEAVKGWRRR